MLRVWSMVSGRQELQGRKPAARITGWRYNPVRVEMREFENYTVKEKLRMSVDDAARIARALAEIQLELREDLLQLLVSQESELKSVLDPRTFSTQFDEIRDKYLDKLAILQGIINELANYSICQTKRVTRIESLSAGDHETLTRMVNKKLASLAGCRIEDVKFLKDANCEDERWVSFITYTPNPLRAAGKRQKSKTE